MKILLDTNIIIEGGKRKEHYKLVDLAKDNNIMFFLSWDIIAEQQSKILSFPPWDFNNLTVKKVDKEWKFWKEINFKNVDDCSFSKLLDYSLNKTEEEILKFANKNEFQLFNELLNKFKVDEKDAINIMVAYSSNMDYFLTWDSKLIRKAKLILWLKPKVTTPSDFIQAMGTK